MVETPKIGIVTVLYNSASVLDDFFEALNKQTYKNFVLYVIDNASPDNSLCKARELVKEVDFSTTIIPELENWGIAKGNNIGIQRALAENCDYVLLANNDIVLEPTTIENLYYSMLAEGATMGVPKIYYYGTNQIWAAGGNFVTWKAETIHFGSLQEDQGQWDNPQVVNYSPTCFMLIDKQVFERVGMMDETYFVYYDDTDFVWRATMKGNEKLMYIPSSRLWHKESTSTGGNVSDFSTFYLHRNAIYFARKHFNLPRRLIVYSYHIAHYFLKKIFLRTAHQRLIVRKAYRESIKLYNNYQRK
ncbi:glycosyl transferase family 2 [Bacteroidia bacterium]|nr:glycosyl transferase family 2 [Bacteroidia bacterium]